MAETRRLTDIVHERLGSVVQPGDVAVDATAGNGHDTLALARLVGESGRVFAFDTQAEALANTRNRLERAGLLNRVELIRQGHEQLKERLPGSICGRLAAAVFNLGYLPGGDKQQITRAATTVPALTQAVDCLKPGGIITVVAYPGHEGGAEEFSAVEKWFGKHPSRLRAVQILDPGRKDAPVLFSGRRQLMQPSSTGH